MIINSYVRPLSNETDEKITESQFKITVNHINSAQKSCLVPDPFNQIYWSPKIENFKLERILGSYRNTTLTQFTELQKEISFYNCHFTDDV